MAAEHHIIFTAEDIEKYHRGLMSSKERHAIEKAALDDPFLADAIDGYVHTQDTSNDLAELKQRLGDRTKEEKKVIPVITSKSSFGWWKVAAMTILVAGAGLLVYQIGFNNTKDDIAQVQQEAAIKKDKQEPDSQKPAATPEIKTMRTDSTMQDEQPVKDTRLTKADSKKKAVKLVQPVAPAIPSDIVKEEPADLSDVAAGITVNKTKEEIKKDNTRNNKSVLAKEKPFEGDQPVISSSSAKQARTPAAVPPKPEDDENKQAFKQPNVFRGRVTDASNNALPFSNIINKEDNIGTYSDANGYFTLTSPDSILNVQVKSIGFLTNTVQLDNKVPNNQVHLQEDRSSLAEVVISNKAVNSNRSRNNNMVLDEPEPADGWANYDLYLANNLNTPETLADKQDGAQKQVVLSFEVNKSGEPVNITVKRSLCQSCDKEAIRLLKEGPKWKRKTKKGKATVTISF